MLDEWLSRIKYIVQIIFLKEQYQYLKTVKLKIFLVSCQVETHPCCGLAVTILRFHSAFDWLQNLMNPGIFSCVHGFTGKNVKIGYLKVISKIFTMSIGIFHQLWIYTRFANTNITVKTADVLSGNCNVSNAERSSNLHAFMISRVNPILFHVVINIFICSMISFTLKSAKLQTMSKCRRCNNFVSTFWVCRR